MAILRRPYISITFFVVIVATLFAAFRYFEDSSDSPTTDLYILSYPNFAKEWGPGPEIARRFEEQHNIKVRWIEASNAGMIIEYLAKNNEYPIDVVLGLDILSLEKAKATIGWKDVPLRKVRFTKDIVDIHVDPEFIPFDWSPMTFIYKRTDGLPPKKLEEFTGEAFVNSLGLQDPNSSATGMYFLIWVLSIMGEEKGYEYLAQLKPSIRVISPSWSAGYSLFQNDQIPYVFSYFTSPLYHHIVENNFNYQPIFFDQPHIYAIEYAGVPTTCKRCDLAQKFVAFLLEKENQKQIMMKNFMLPAVLGVKDKTEFDFSQNIQLIRPKAFKELLEKKESLLERWRDLQL